MNEILTLPDGTPVGTGLQTPTSLSTAFPLYDDAPGLMLTDAKRLAGTADVDAMLKGVGR